MTQTTNATGVLLSHLWRGGQWAHYWTNAGKESMWFPVDKIPPIPAKWARKNVYFSVHPCREIPPTNSKGEKVGRESIRVQNEYVAAVNGVFAEFDAKHFEGGKAAILAHIKTFPQDRGWPFPSVIVDSGGGYHCYWLLEDTVTVTDENRDTLRAIQATWVTLVGGDAAAKDFARVLRVPGTLNVKPEYGPDFRTVTVIEADFRRLYSLAEFERLTEHLRKAPEPQPVKTATQNTPTPVPLDDEKLLERAKAASNGVDFEHLWNGVTTDYNSDHSGADMALCCHLAFWTARDTKRMDRMFRASGLMRPKWDVVHHSDGSTYGSKTISRAIAKTSEVYTPTMYVNGNGYIPDEAPPGVGNQWDIMPSWSVAEDPPDWDNSAPTIRITDDPPPTDEQLADLENAPDAGASLAGLLGELDAIGEDDRQAVTLFALDNVSTLAGMDKTAVATFCTHLRGKGVTADWIRTDLRPAINEAKKEAAGQEGGGLAANGPTWTHYVDAARALGYSFRLNDLNDATETKGERMNDVSDAVLLSKLHAQGLRNVDVARRAFTTAASLNRYHPVKQYLEGLKWDGKDTIARLAGYFTDSHEPVTYSDGTQKTVFYAFFYRWLVGAVAKVYDARNCQNRLLILDGAQGIGKSYFPKWLCPLPELHFEGAIRPDDKDYLLYLTTRWVWEVSELGATMRKADRESLKTFLTLQDATYRPSYGRHPLVKPALASFIGTVNFEGALLGDPTGNRRFWPVNLAGLDWNYSQEVDVNQLWAQAYAHYRNGAAWALSTEELAAHAAIVSGYEAEDVLAGYVQEYFIVDPSNDGLFMTTTAILSVLRDPEGADLKGSEKALSMQLATSLMSLGLTRHRRWVASEKTQRWGYVGITKRLA